MGRNEGLQGVEDENKEVTSPKFTQQPPLQHPLESLCLGLNEGLSGIAGTFPQRAQGCWDWPGGGEEECEPGFCLSYWRSFWKVRHLGSAATVTVKRMFVKVICSWVFVCVGRGAAGQSILRALYLNFINMQDDLSSAWLELKWCLSRTMRMWTCLAMTHEVVVTCSADVSRCWPGPPVAELAVGHWKTRSWIYKVLKLRLNVRTNTTKHHSRSAPRMTISTTHRFYSMDFNLILNQIKNKRLNEWIKDIRWLHWSQ